MTAKPLKVVERMTHWIDQFDLLPPQTRVDEEPEPKEKQS